MFLLFPFIKVYKLIIIVIITIYVIYILIELTSCKIRIDVECFKERYIVEDNFVTEFRVNLKYK